MSHKKFWIGVDFQQGCNYVKDILREDRVVGYFMLEEASMKEFPMRGGGGDISSKVRQIYWHYFKND